MEYIKLEDVLIEPVVTTVEQVAGKTLGEVSKGQLLGLMETLPADTSTAAARSLPPAITFQEDEE